jgi:hypothetical protein
MFFKKDVIKRKKAAELHSPTASANVQIKMIDYGNVMTSANNQKKR